MAVRRLLSVLILLPVLLLTGCLRYLADYEIVNADEVTLSTDIALLTTAVQEMGADAPDFCADSAYAGNPNATLQPYTDDEYSGCRISLTGTVDEVSDGNTTIELVDGVWTFRQNNEDAQDSVDSAELFTDFRISVTFPGEVLEHSGSSTVSGRTVTWTDPVDFLSGDGVYATGRDGSAGGIDWWWWGVGILVGLAIIGIAMGVIRAVRRTRGSHQGMPPPENRGGDPRQQGPYPPGPQGGWSPDHGMPNSDIRRPPGMPGQASGQDPWAPPPPEDQRPFPQ